MSLASLLTRTKAIGGGRTVERFLSVVVDSRRRSVRKGTCEIAKESGRIRAERRLCTRVAAGASARTDDDVQAQNRVRLSGFPLDEHGAIPRVEGSLPGEPGPDGREQ